jgi:hypothetical protein
MGASTDLASNITDLIDNYLASGYPPAAAVAVYHGENQLFELTVGRGLANIESGLKAGPEVIFELGSVTLHHATRPGFAPDRRFWRERRRIHTMAPERLSGS